MNAFILTNVVGTATRSLGAEVIPEGVHYTVWAPERKKVSVIVQADKPRTLILAKDATGYFTGIDPSGREGDRYTLTIDDRENLPDLASRYQPDGVFGPSMVIDPNAFALQTPDWKRPAWNGHILYELHVGTFTTQGTFRSAINKLDYLADLGVTAVELMPVTECTGTRNWGYDGVLLFAPYHPYGTPDDMRAFVDACHARGLAVVLDAVYNHIGAVGDVTEAYSKHISHPENTGAWGKGFNLDGDHSAPVRHFLLQNIHYWLEEFRIDGYRLDATHAIRDKSEVHLLVQATEIIHAHGGFVTAEDDRNSAEILKPRADGGYQLDAVWSDDFHHTMRVSQTREEHSYLGNYAGTLEEMAETLRHGWFFRGQPHPKLRKPRGTASLHLAPERFVCCISNHDQVGNRPFGERLHDSISPEAWRALSLFFCLIPYTPMLFMGQEWAASSPFFYFTDHPEDFGKLVMAGRRREFKFDAQQHHQPLPDCQAEATFRDSKLNWDELQKSPHRENLSLYREALQLRRKWFGTKNPTRGTWNVEVRSGRLIIDYRLPEINFSVALSPTQCASNDAIDSGTVLLRSNDPRFGGSSDNSLPETIVVTRP
jgi:maltooligosyltrehalose trehalohydrolase